MRKGWGGGGGGAPFVSSWTTNLKELRPGLAWAKTLGREKAVLRTRLIPPGALEWE